MIEVFDKERRRLAVLENAMDISEDRRANALWYFSFSLPAGDPKNRFCRPFYLIRADGGETYRIMPSAMESGETGLVAYQCEHVLATLLDKALFGAYVVGNIGTPTAAVIRWLLEQQPVRHWQLGRCDFSRQFQYAWEQENLLAALFSVATPLAEEYLWTFDTASYPWTLNLERLDLSAKPELFIRTRKNLLRFTGESDPRQVCTRLYPLGYGEGINQLGIAGVNGGVPYLQSPKAYTDLYGIVERVWVDRRYEDANSLLAAAGAMLKELQEPMAAYAIAYTPVEGDPAPRVGMRVQVDCIDAKERISAIITGIKRTCGDLPGVELTLANRAADIAGTVADLADRQRIESTYAQGATQVYSQALQANCDSKNGAVMDFFIPAEMRIINKVLCKVRLGSFRSYSQATNTSRTTVVSSTTSDSRSATSDAGGGYSSTSDAGGGESATSSAGGGEALTVDSGVDVDVYDRSTSYNGTADVAPHSHTYRWVNSHKHRLFLRDHTHDFYVEPHTHEFDIPSHSHRFTVYGHSHDVAIPSHSHEITPGIFFFGNPKSFSLYVNGTRKASFSTTDAELDLTPYLMGDGRRIPRGSWLSLEIRPDDLAYVSLDLMVQGFVQSRGDYTV